MSYEFQDKTLEAEGEMILQYGEAGYDWQLVEVWRRKLDGRLFMAAGQGCSCNGLYDEIGSWEDMIPILSFDPIRKAVDAWYSYRPTATQVIDGMRKINKALGI
jgi:hypothetical protein